MVGAAGIEPATVGLEIRCSIRLSYAPSLLRPRHKLLASGASNRSALSGYGVSDGAGGGLQFTAFKPALKILASARIPRNCPSKPTVVLGEATTLRPRRPLSVAMMRDVDLIRCRSALHVHIPVCPDPAHDHEPEARAPCGARLGRLEGTDKFAGHIRDSE